MGDMIRFNRPKRGFAYYRGYVLTLWILTHVLALLYVAVRYGVRMF